MWSEIRIAGLLALATLLCSGCLAQHGITPGENTKSVGVVDTRPCVANFSVEGGYWAGHTVYPVTKLSPERAANIVQQFGIERVMVHSAADWGPSDALSVPRVILELRKRGFPREKIQRLVWDNPLSFYSRSGKIPPFP